MPRELPELLLPHAAAWRRWLRAHCDSSPGVWLVLAKKGTTDPTTLTYDQALEEALCHGWIDGQPDSQGRVHVPSAVHAASASQRLVADQREARDPAAR